MLICPAAGCGNGNGTSGDAEGESDAAGGALGMAFGAGAGCMTRADTDGGNFITRAGAYYDAGPPPLCGP